MATQGPRHTGDRRMPRKFEAVAPDGVGRLTSRCRPDIPASGGALVGFGGGDDHVARARRRARLRSFRSVTRREFIRVLAAAAAAGFALDAKRARAAADALYDPPTFGNVSLLHFTDCHAQLRPIYFREPSVNLGVGAAANRPPHLVGDRLLRYVGIAPGTREAHALTHLDFAKAAAVYGRVGGFAHLATLVKRLEASRPGALLLDAGDTWQGSATALWRSEEHTSELQSLAYLVCRLLLEKKKNIIRQAYTE